MQPNTILYENKDWAFEINIIYMILYNEELHCDVQELLFTSITFLSSPSSWTVTPAIYRITERFVFTLTTVETLPAISTWWTHYKANITTLSIPWYICQHLMIWTLCFSVKTSILLFCYFIYHYAEHKCVKKELWAI